MSDPIRDSFKPIDPQELAAKRARRTPKDRRSGKVIDSVYGYRVLDKVPDDERVGDDTVAMQAAPRKPMEARLTPRQTVEDTTDFILKGMLKNREQVALWIYQARQNGAFPDKTDEEVTTMMPEIIAGMVKAATQMAFEHQNWADTAIHTSTTYGEHAVDIDAIAATEIAGVDAVDSVIEPTVTEVD